MQIQRKFNGSASAETCKEYLKDDPRVKVKIIRKTRENLMRGIHQMAVDSGHYAKAEAILDYFLPETLSSPAEVSCDDFIFVTKVGFGGSEGIYLDCYAEGRIQPDGEKRPWHLGTYKTLDTSLSAMQTLGELGGTLTYFADKYLMEVIAEAEGIVLTACDDYDSKAYLLYQPMYPWNITDADSGTTEEKVAGIFRHYVSILVEDPIDIDYQAVENGG